MNRQKWQRAGLVATAGIIWLVFFGFLGRHTTDSIARAVSSSLQSWLRPVAPVPSSPAPAEPVPVVTFNSLGEHPRTAFDLERSGKFSYHAAFDRMLERFAVRQGVDDNFTVRVYDNRTDEVLEVFELDSTRALYDQRDSTNWTAVDQERRRVTKLLLDKYESAGVPRDDLSVRWGRANQIRESFERNEPYLQYEVRLARWLDLSLLATQIGTVETFNQPKLVSPAGARGQYQMMPYMLHKFGIQQYDLRTEAGTHIEVREEHHPLLTMKPALLLVRAYSNAVGHELPGVSAYHSGPGNIFNLLRYFLIEHDPSAFNEPRTVADGYLWALTDGFPLVSDRTSFGFYSRGYVPAAFGSLRALEDQVVDTTQTISAEQVQLKPQSELLLGDLLRAIQEDSTRVSSDDRRSVVASYEEFRRLNPHFDLPRVIEGEEIPAEANVWLTARSEGHAVQFFLPRGAVEALRAVGVDVVDTNHVKHFDDRTYHSGAYAKDSTEWDRAYTELVNRVRRFGFTHAHREQLDTIAVHMEHLAEERPTPFREAQARIVQIHQQMWDSRPWRRLADVVAAREGSYIVPPRALDLPRQELPTKLSAR
jgi:hypothetical protein